MAADALVESSRDIIADDGRILMFSTERFARDIIERNHCFICGIAPDEVTFNNEHVIPRWALKRYGLFVSTITMPNGQRIRYDRLTVPCCKPCNSFLGRMVEEEVAELLMGDAETVLSRIGEKERNLLFVWLTLLFVKTHLKDRLVRWHKNPIDGTESIAEGHNWEQFHHMFEVARAPYTGAHLMPETRGSFCIFGVQDETTLEKFDFVDMTDEATVAVRLGDIGMVAVLNDAGLAEQLINHHIGRVDGPVSCVQLREIAARLAMANADLISRPRFLTMVIRAPALRVRLCAYVPQLQVEPLDAVRFGRLLTFAMGNHIETLMIDGDGDPESVRSKLASGNVSFLIGDDGRFQHDGAQTLP